MPSAPEEPVRPRPAGSPGSMVMPPRLGKHQGARVTSTSLAGSQTPRDSPIRGMGDPQKQIGEPGLGVSGAPEALPMETGPMEMGNRHSQQTSVMGFTKRPVQACAQDGAGRNAARSTTSNHQARYSMLLISNLPFPAGREPPPPLHPRVFQPGAGKTRRAGPGWGCG